MSDLGGADPPSRLLWPWLVVAGAAVLAATTLILLVVLTRPDAARTLTLVPGVGEWSRSTDDWTARKAELADLALEYVHPGVDIGTATYVRDDGTELRVGTMATTEGDDIEEVVLELEDSVYGLVLAHRPQAIDEVEPGPLGGRMTCTVVVLPRTAEVACGWQDRTTAGALAVRYARNANMDIDLAELTRRFRAAMTQGS